MPTHGQMTVNVISEDKSKIGVTDVDRLRTPMSVVKSHLLKSGVFPVCDDFCAACTVTANGCVMLRETVQKMMDEGSLRFEKVALENEDISTITIYFDPVHLSGPTDVVPITITVPGPIPYESDGVVPWDYGGDVYCNGKKKEDQAAVDTTVSRVDNVGLSGFTRSGRLFAPNTLRGGDVEKEQRDKAEALAREKGKQVVNEDTPREAQAPVEPESEFDAEAEEFLRIIKKSEDASLKILKWAYVPQEITVNQLETVVSSVNASHGLGFTDLVLTMDGRNHNKALHISMECKGVVLSHVLVDTGSSLTVLPKKALAKLDCEGLILRPTDLVVRAFDGSKRAVFGEVELPVKIGPEKLKYILDGQVVTVCGEEDIFVSQLSSFKYVEMDGEIFKTPSQAFETVKVENAIFAEREKKPSIASYKQAVEVVKSGEAPGWGRVIDVAVKEDKFGIGYQSGQGSSGQNKGRRQPFAFTSAGMLDPGRICAMGEEIDNFILLNLTRTDVRNPKNYCYINDLVPNKVPVHIPENIAAGGDTDEDYIPEQASPSTYTHPHTTHTSSKNVAGTSFNQRPRRRNVAPATLDEIYVELLRRSELDAQRDLQIQNMEDQQIEMLQILRQMQND
ncbi:uncharacterized protein LOC127103025 [Lathyrus oleraceus]|uniref:uncharacterized protein LOC127103025 n=1 Tax=Pisum sativum TaxID=3888 RepID=UPI0021D3A508|nr:uncharacterized protein LOC127103025 [Pisum sativum]